MMRSTLEEWIENKTGCTNSVSLEQWQMARLREAVARARSLSRFYRKLYRDVDVDKLRNRHDLVHLPLTSASELAADPNSWSCCNAGEVARIVTLKTSGTTHSPKRIFFTERDQQLTVDFFAHGMLDIASAPGRTMILMPCEQEGGIGQLLAEGLSRIAVESIPAGPVADIAASYALLRETGCTCVVGIPVQVLALAQYHASLLSHERIRLRSVLISADTTPKSLVAEIGRLFDCEVFTHFGMTEMGFGCAVECVGHNGCHIRECDLLLEIVDPLTGMPVADGEKGEIVFTSLNREAMPFIRYRTGDWGRLLPGCCICGSWIRRLQPEGGRIAEDVILPGNRERVPLLWQLDELLLGCDDLVNISTTLTGNHLHIVLQGIKAPNIAEAQKRLWESVEFGPLLESGALTLSLDVQCITGFSENGMQKRTVGT